MAVEEVWVGLCPQKPGVPSSEARGPQLLTSTLPPTPALALLEAQQSLCQGLQGPRPGAMLGG